MNVRNRSLRERFTISPFRLNATVPLIEKANSPRKSGSVEKEGACDPPRGSHMSRVVSISRSGVESPVGRRNSGGADLKVASRDLHRQTSARPRRRILKLGGGDI